MVHTPTAYKMSKNVMPSSPLYWSSLMMTHDMCQNMELQLCKCLKTRLLPTENGLTAVVVKSATAC
jgi:hypothetical protein